MTAKKHVTVEPVAVCLEAGAANSIINLSIVLPTSRSWPDFAAGDSNRA